MRTPFSLILAGITTPLLTLAADTGWKKHVVHEGFHTNTAVAGDFTGDGKPDIIANNDDKTRLFTAPDWKETIIDATPGLNCIHSEVFDVDGDGDLDFIGARYQPGLIFWLENPGGAPNGQSWKNRLVSEELNGIHGLLRGDVNKDGKIDLLANSAQPVKTDHPISLAWLEIPAKPHEAEKWDAHIFARGDAPGLTHYLGLGDVNGDGRPDAATGAKGKPSLDGNYFAWWEAPEDPKAVWTKHLIAENQLGATNIHPADVNGDGKTDFIASLGHGHGVVWFEAPDWKRHAIHETLKEPHSLIVLDFDGDGDQDAATCAFGDRQAWWFENDGKGTFTNHLVAEDQAAYDIRALDMDGDKDLDLIIAGQRSQNVVWYENPGKKLAKIYSGKPLQVLLVTGGCCHNYLFQSLALTTGLENRADVEVHVVNEGGTGTRAQIALYDDPNWAKEYDVVIHNECFANTKDAEYIRKITTGHKGGTPSVVVHCAMHTYRAAEIDDWREFLGVTSKKHEHQSRYPVRVLKTDHPTMKGMKQDWVTPKDELYIIDKLWPNATTLAVSKSEKTGEEHPVIWTNDYYGTRVFGTTYGHSDDTFRDEVFIDLLSRGVVWAAGKLQE